MSFDYFNLPDNAINNQVFYTKGSGTDFQIWTKPKNARLVHILCIGSGSGGGAGQYGSSGTARRGGGGGGSSGYSFGIFQASLIPDNLFLLIPTGGAGGTGITLNGSSGALSYVSIEPNITAINILLQSGAVAPTGGTSGAGGGNAGIGGTIYAGAILDIGITRFLAGQNGTAGQTTPVPTDLTLNRILSGGSAGAGTNGATPQAGANIIGGGFINNISGGSGSSSGIAGNGSNGYIGQMPMVNGLQRQPILFTGGTGGGSSNTGTGGVGGNGAYGSGGGGGGAGFINIAGNGGRGGDGLIIINCY